MSSRHVISRLRHGSIAKLQRKLHIQTPVQANAYFQQCATKQQSIRTIATRTRVCQGPPMPRVMPEVVQSLAANKVEPKPGSTWLRNFGILILGVLAVDNVLQYLHAKEAQDKIAQLHREEEEQRTVLFEEWKDKPTLLQVQVVFPYKMGGSMGLRGVQIGNTLEVVQENVGPNKKYYLCRSRDSETRQVQGVGWYPMGFCEKQQQVDTKTGSTRKKILGLF